MVVGFYSLAVGSVDPESASLESNKGPGATPGAGHDPGPTRGDKEHQRKGLGQALLKDALLRTAQAAVIAGICCLLVLAKDDTAQR